MNCSECSNPLTPNAKFCKSCGAKQNSSPAPTAATEKVCGQCHALCKPQARFCPRCGAVFDASSTAAPTPAEPSNPALMASAVQKAPDEVQAATIFQSELPLIGAKDLSAPPPVISADTSADMSPPSSPATAPFPPHYTSPTPAHSPVFPQKPVQSSKSWIKWAALAVLVAAIAGGVLMANNMKALSGANSAPTASQANKDAMSPEDKAKADALVGPQGGNPASPTGTAAPLNDPSSVTITPAVQTPPPAASNPTSQLPPPSTALPATPSAPSPALPAAVSSKPAPAKVQPVKKNAAPSLNDLLD